MAVRPSWKGHLRLSLVTVPVCLYNAVSSASRISMNQLHKECHKRLKQQMVCPDHGSVDRSDIVKGYEYEKDRYVIIEESDLDSVKIESSKAVDITQFIDAAELDAIYLESPYYVGPDGPMAEEAFRVIREAMKQTNKVGIGRLAMGGRENVVVLQPFESGFRLTTLRAADEVKAVGPYFEGIRPGEVQKDQLKLAEQLIEGLSAPLDLSIFRDRYQEGLLAMIKAKVEGSAPVVAQEEQVGQVINLMDALKQSVAQSAQKKPPAASVKRAPARERKAKRA